MWRLGAAQQRIAVYNKCVDSMYVHTYISIYLPIEYIKKKVYWYTRRMQPKVLVRVVSSGKTKQKDHPV